MAALPASYTPPPEPVLIDTIYDIKGWMSPVSIELHNLTTPHAFKIVKSESGKVVMQYKNWASQKEEPWKPNTGNSEEWIPILKVY